MLWFVAKKKKKKQEIVVAINKNLFLLVFKSSRIFCSTAPTRWEHWRISEKFCVRFLAVRMPATAGAIWLLLLAPDSRMEKERKSNQQLVFRSLLSLSPSLSLNSSPPFYHHPGPLPLWRQWIDHCKSASSSSGCEAGKGCPDSRHTGAREPGREGERELARMSESRCRG